MASAAIGEVVRQVHRLYGEGTVAGLSESELLDQFSRRRDEIAFAALVARHGPMVRGVCRGVLRDPNDADDAFQATFLVLARKAGSIRGRDALGGWLHRVARRVAVRASVESSRRRLRERPGVVEEPIAPAEDPDRRELCRVVHEEVDRLPENDRKAVVLCDLEGRTHEEAADRLGWPVGTVKGRLFRARVRLRDRLARRGFSAPAASSAALARRSIAAVVPDVLLQSTVRLAASAASSRAAAGLVPASVALAEGVLRAMFWNQAKIPAAAALGAAALTIGLGSMALGGPRADDRKTEAPASPEDLRKAIQGDWYPRSFLKDGGPVPLPKERNFRVWPDRMGSVEGPPQERADYTLLADRTPAGIDVVVPAGPDAGKTLRGIVKVEGETLTLCFGERAEMPRPGDFVSRKGEGQQLNVFSRTRPDRAVNEDDFRKAILGDWYARLVEKDGKATPFPKEAMQVTAEEIGGKAEADRGKYTLQFGRSPIGIEITSLSGSDKGKVYPGIIQLEGETLSLCWARPGSPRPEAFASRKGTGHHLVILARTPQAPGRAEIQATPTGTPVPPEPAQARVDEESEDDLRIELDILSQEIKARQGDLRHAFTNVSRIRRQLDALKAGVPFVPSDNADASIEPIKNKEEGALALAEAERLLRFASEQSRKATQAHRDIEQLAEARRRPKPGPTTPPPAAPAPSVPDEPKADPARAAIDREQAMVAITGIEAQITLAEIDLNAIQGQLSAVQQNLYALRSQSAKAGLGVDTRAALDTSLAEAINADRDLRKKFLDQSRDLGRLRAQADRMRSLSDEPKSGAPGVVKVGDSIVIEVLEALPGRPIQGPRTVRADGTVGLGFYGDLKVAGLDRRQVKEAVVNHLRKFLTDEVLGLSSVDSETNRATAVPPAETDRVYVDEAPGTGPNPARVDELEKKLDRLIRAIEGRKPGIGRP